MNLMAIKVIYLNEMMRFWKTLFQSVASPVISTALYFVVFGSAIGSRIENIDGVSYGLFIVPGLTMLSVLTQSISNASFGIFSQNLLERFMNFYQHQFHFMKPQIGYVGAAATKSLILATIILVTANLFVELNIAHPFWMLGFLVLTCIAFSLFGFIIGLWADNFEKLQIIPLLIITH